MNVTIFLQYEIQIVEVHVANFVKKNPPQTIILVDPNDWAIALENLTLNTTECCQVCSIAEGIARAKKGIETTGLGQVCSCHTCRN